MFLALVFTGTVVCCYCCCEVFDVMDCAGPAAYHCGVYSRSPFSQTAHGYLSAADPDPDSICRMLRAYTVGGPCPPATPHRLAHCGCRLRQWPRRLLSLQSHGHQPEPYRAIRVL